MPPGQTVDGPLIVTTGAAVIATFAFALPLHEPFVTVIASVVLPDAPAVKLMAVVPCPLLIVPFVIVHAYVAPACEATLAFALAFAQTFAGAAIVGVALANTVTFFDAPPLQPFASTTLTL